MFTKLHWIEKFDNGAALGITARPRGNDWLTDEISRWKEVGIKTIVSLLEKEEIEELGLLNEDSLCRENGIAYINFPIKDRGLPSNKVEVDKLIQVLKDKIEKGEKIVIHCRMGIGRASIIAGAVLIERGLKTTEINEKISKVRELKVPDTEEQVLWLKQREKKYL